MYPIYLSNGCDDNTKYGGLIIGVVMVCSPRSIAFNFRTIGCSQGQDNFLQSCAATNYTCRRTFHKAACYETNILSLLSQSPLHALCPIKYIAELKSSRRLIVRYGKCLNMTHDVNLDIWFLCGLVVSDSRLETKGFLVRVLLLAICRCVLCAVIARLISQCM